MMMKWGSLWLPILDRYVVMNLHEGGIIKWKKLE